MYEEVSRAPNHFSVVLFLRRCKSTAKTKAKQSLSHNSPEKPTYLGKIGLFLGKSKKKKETRDKSKEKEKIIPLFLIKKNSFFPSLGKIVGILGKITPTTNILTLQIFIIRNKCLFLHYNSVKRFKRKWI